MPREIPASLDLSTPVRQLGLYGPWVQRADDNSLYLWAWHGERTPPDRPADVSMTADDAHELYRFLNDTRLKGR